MTTPYPIWLKCLLFGLLLAGALIGLDMLLGRDISPARSLLIGFPLDLFQYWGLAAKASKTRKTKQ